MMSNDASLSGRTILIVGASSGMGRATALAAAESGAGLILVARNRNRLREVEQAAKAQGAASVLCLQADAEDSQALAAAFADEEQALSAVDTVVNTVGMNIVNRTFVELTEQSWQSMMDTNLTAAFNLNRYMVPLLRKRGGGLLINVSSTAARKPDPSGAAYQASKAAVMAMTHAIMEEEWQNGIRATVILPGMTDTPLLEKRPTPPTQEMRDKALQPEDVADACLFVMRLPPRAHVSELMLQPAMR